MNKLLKRMAVSASICLVGTFLFVKSLGSMGNDVLSLLTDNVEALSYIDYYEVPNTGPCGVKLRQNVGTEYEYWIIRCKISRDEMTSWINAWNPNYVNYCDNYKSCSSSSYCSGAY